jgi:hypothetical protein
MNERAGHAPEHLTAALGEAVVQVWSDLPQNVQHRLFEEAVVSKGEAIRSPLAALLHGMHRRTAASVTERREAIEPDSLGG